jgi:hypothetical protein
MRSHDMTATQTPTASEQFRARQAEVDEEWRAMEFLNVGNLFTAAVSLGAGAALVWLAPRWVAYVVMGAVALWLVLIGLPGLWKRRSAK